MRNPLEVARLPQFQVAGYSLLLLASVLACGFQRSADFLPLPKWRGKYVRPSILDILNLLRQQIFGRHLETDAQDSFGHFAEIHPIGAKSQKYPISFGIAGYPCRLMVAIAVAWLRSPIERCPISRAGRSPVAYLLITTRAP